MKDRILMLVIGILVGAVISTGAFFVYSKSTTCHTKNHQMQMPGGNPPSMQSGQLPEMKNNDNTQNNNAQSNSNTQNDTSGQKSDN